MKKILCTIFLFCSVVQYALPFVNSAGNAAAITSPMRSISRSHSDKEDHRLRYHNGPITSYTMVIEYKNLSNRSTDYYDKVFYYYKADPDKCIIDVEITFSHSEPMTQLEYEDAIRIKRIITILVTILCGIALVALVIVLISYYGGIYGKYRNRKDTEKT